MDCSENSAYLNPAMENYECEGQINLFEYIEMEQDGNGNKLEHTMSGVCSDIDSRRDYSALV